tara:strand:- start:23364 stop:24539 length:1176 start_codon:yes stop_codon:yes gene_type:complete
MRSKAFFVNGGAGRVLCSIPAFEKYAETHDDFIIVAEGGTDFFKGHPTLDGKVYDMWHKNLFQEHLKHRDCVSPEPYRMWHYYNQKCSLTQAFDMEINGLDEPRELPKPTLNLTKMEVIAGYNMIQEVKSVSGKDKVVVIQPFGRGVQQVGEFIADASSRSMSLVNTVDIINDLKKDYGIIVMSELQFPVEENEEKSKYKIARPQIEDIRVWAAIIDVADHFIGVDSIGQHICKSLDKKATVVIGSTYPVNISYPEDSNFDIIDIGVDRRKYSPIRLTMDETVDRYNDQSMEMSAEQVKSILRSARKHLGKPVSFKGTYTPPQSTECPTCPPGTSATPAIAQGNTAVLPGSAALMPQPQWSQPPANIVEKPKKPKVGFKNEVKNLLKTDIN